MTAQFLPLLINWLQISLKPNYSITIKTTTKEMNDISSAYRFPLHVGHVGQAVYLTYIFTFALLTYTSFQIRRGRPSNGCVVRSKNAN